MTVFPEKMRPALVHTGTLSGRDGDKLTDDGLTPEYTELGNPIFKEANLAIKCRIIYSAPFIPERIDNDVRQVYNNGMGIHQCTLGKLLMYGKIVF